jgi:hypothetical protein
MQFAEPFALWKGRSVDPEDEWLPEFQSYDGLIIQTTGKENCTQLHKRR